MAAGDEASTQREARPPRQRQRGKQPKVSGRERASALLRPRAHQVGLGHERTALPGPTEPQAAEPCPNQLGAC